jgi:hypothetical protein
MNKNYLEGGLKMINLDTYIEAIQKNGLNNSQGQFLPIGKPFLSITLTSLALN